MGRTALVTTALLLSLCGRPAQAQEPIRLMGFFTFELEGSDGDDQDQPWTFDQHQLNLITTWDLDDSWRAMSEIEWEHGTKLGAAGGSGEVMLVRSWIEYRHSAALQVRAGKFLPPFGIYNLRHDAAPTFLMTFLPGPIYGKHANTTGGSQLLYPKFATGVQLLGRVYGESISASYYLYVSNGRGVNPAEQDDNGNKGIGGRVLVESHNGAVIVGASAYQDRNGTAAHVRQGSFAADVRFRIRGFEVESEFLVPRLERVDTHGSATGTFRRGRGYYVQGSRPLRDQITPFLRYEAYDSDIRMADDREYAVVAGVNVALTSRVYLKGETHFRDFEAGDAPSYRMYVFSLAAAF